jgi:hypothetical protein
VDYLSHDPVSTKPLAPPVSVGQGPHGAPAGACPVSNLVAAFAAADELATCRDTSGWPSSCAAHASGSSV